MPAMVKAMLDNREIPSSFIEHDGKMVITLESETRVSAGQSLTVQMQAKE
jgi:hypothetical protein